MTTVSVRYIVNDVGEAAGFYAQHLGFHLDMHPDPAFAMLSRGDLRLVLVSPVGADHPGGGSRPLPDGTPQRPGGWNRIMLEVEDVETVAAALRYAGVAFRTDVITGVGTKQAMIEDPSGNPIEIYQPLRAEARLSAP
jgi:catechol 2,3-dioxygenase-like lactoylglutathione lyase family enzyme